ncbi:hypothetical protein D9758_013647 [Tetrapyrgos nigripes]|uniref:GST N-terminal domain-containing protein n=1 Tax=Tetrapyrgos nigripes TaxID=182062 RepID=A0A8H5CP29_9AGAR|nr:hypothetical protein D9758_013647 [Tetrapyrgos nigripes]
MAHPEDIVYYDIASRAPVTCFAPNPWKARYALNFKNVDYRTHWVEHPDVTSTRKSLGVAPSRYWPDGTPFYTMPVLQIKSTGELVGDTFEIALWLDKTYPNSVRRLIPEGTVGLHRTFNKYADTMLSRFYKLFSHGLPFNPDTAEESKRIFVQRAQVQDWEELTVRGEEREAVLKEFQKALGELSECYVKGECSGPFLEGGDQPTYADIIVGGWLQFISRTVPEWEVIAKWHGGRWGDILRALEEYAVVH